MRDRKHEGRPPARRPGRVESEWEWFRETARARAATLKRWLVHPAAILGCLHLLLMLWVRGCWRAAIQVYGMPVGRWADLASGVASWVDFAVSWLCESIAYGDGHGPSRGVYTIVSFFGVRSHADLTLGVHWPLLLLLGTAQWVAIGFVLAFIQSRRRGTSPAYRSARR
jgi:hypothetical protein